MTRYEVYQDHRIEIRDGYMDGTALCQANDKIFEAWDRNKRTQELKDEIESDARILASELVRSGRQHGHSYVHPARDDLFPLPRTGLRRVRPVHPVLAGRALHRLHDAPAAPLRRGGGPMTMPAFLQLLAFVLALVSFALAAANVPARWNLIATGLAALTVGLILAGFAGVPVPR
jgi:hypothetical protein